MVSCVDCRHYDKAPAGARYDRCKHVVAQRPTMTASANHAGTDRCVVMRQFLGACGWSGSLFKSEAAA